MQNKSERFVRTVFTPRHQTELRLEKTPRKRRIGTQKNVNETGPNRRHGPAGVRRKRFQTNPTKEGMHSMRKKGFS